MPAFLFLLLIGCLVILWPFSERRSTILSLNQQVKVTMVISSPYCFLPASTPHKTISRCCDHFYFDKKQLMCLFVDIVVSEELELVMIHSLRCLSHRFKVVYIGRLVMNLIFHWVFYYCSVPLLAFNINIQINKQTKKFNQ